MDFMQLAMQILLFVFIVHVSDFLNLNRFKKNLTCFALYISMQEKIFHKICLMNSYKYLCYFCVHSLYEQWIIYLFYSIYTPLMSQVGGCINHSNYTSSGWYRYYVMTFIWSCYTEMPLYVYVVLTDVDTK